MTIGVVEDEPLPPAVVWSEFVEHFRWKQGEHVALIGPTGAGKTTMALWLLPMRNYITVLATKPRDSTLDQFGKQNGFRKYTEWPKISPHVSPRRIIWPDARNIDSQAKQKAVFSDALQRIYRQGGWCVYIDELWYIGQILGLTQLVKVYLQQARSMGISLIVSSQRPAWIPLEVYDQSTHLFFWRDNDERNLSRIGGMSVHSASLIRYVVSNLPAFHVLYINTRTGDMLVTRPPGPTRKV